MNHPPTPEMFKVPPEVMNLWLASTWGTELYSRTDSAGRGFYQLSRSDNYRLSITRFLNGGLVFHTIINDISAHVSYSQALTEVTKL